MDEYTAPVSSVGVPRPAQLCRIRNGSQLPVMLREHKPSSAQHGSAEALLGQDCIARNSPVVVVTRISSLLFEAPTMTSAGMKWTCCVRTAEARQREIVT